MNQEINYRFSNIWSEPLPRLIDNVESWMTSKEEQKLQEIVSGSDLVLEIGTYEGHSAKKMAEVANQIITIDINGNIKIDEIIEKNSNITFIKGNCMDPDIFSSIQNNTLDILFIDGCHLLQEVWDNVITYFPKVKIGGIIIFHDNLIREEVTSIVQDLKEKIPLIGTFESLAWLKKDIDEI